MNLRYLIISTIVLLSTLASSCLKDKGNYDYKELNEITISGIDKDQRYEVFSFVDTLRISPTIEGMGNSSAENFTYEWKIMPRSGDDTKDSIDRVVGRSHNLEYPVVLEEGNYTGYFTVTDHQQGATWGETFSVLVRTLTTEGFMVLSEENGQGRMDMISNLSEDEYVVAYNVWQEEGYSLGKPKSLHYNYNRNLPSSTIYVSEGGSYLLDKSLMLSEASNFGWTFGSAMEQVFVQGTSSTTFSYNTPRELVITETGELYARNTFTMGSVFEFPINFINGVDEFKPSPIIGMPIPNNAGGYWPYGHTILLYDDTNKQFLELSEKNEFPTKLHFNNINLFPIQTGRDIIHASSTLNRQTFAVLKEPSDASVYIYGMNLGPDGANSQSYYLQAIGPEIEQAKEFAFHPILPYMFYSTENRVYQFDYSQPDAPAKVALEYLDSEIITLDFFPMVGWNPYNQWERDKALLLVVGRNKIEPSENPGVVEFYTAPSLSRPLEQKAQLEDFGKIIDIQLRERDAN